MLYTVSSHVKPSIEEQKEIYTKQQAVCAWSNKHGQEALLRIAELALSTNKQGKIVANFILNCYNDQRFKMELSTLYKLDPAVLEDCMAILRMNFYRQHEVHTIIPNGKKIIEGLILKYKIKDCGLEPA